MKVLVLKQSHNLKEPIMSTKQKLGYISSIAAIVISGATLLFSSIIIPYKAGSVVERVEACEEKVYKIDEIAEDVSYIRGWIDNETRE